MRLVPVLIILSAACGNDAVENPVIEPEPSSSCETDERLVHDVCTEVGPTDGCVEVDTVCIALCEPSTTTCDGELRLFPLASFPTAPDGYCVCCAPPGEPCP